MADTNRGIEWSLRAFASSVFIFASTSSCQIFLASSEHFSKYRWRAASTSGKIQKDEQRALRVLRKFSASQNLSFILGYVVLRQVIANNQADTS